MTDKWKTREMWLAEIAPKKSGNFVRADAMTGAITNTQDPWDAMLFLTRKKCEDWCENHSGVECTPVQHGFAEKE